MTNPVDPLIEAANALRSTWPDDGGSGASLGGMTGDEVLALNQQIAGLRRHVEALHASIAGELAARSRPELGKQGLARQAGFRTPAKLIAAATGGHSADAARLVQVGEATRDRTTLSGEAAPPKHPHIAEALRAGTLNVQAGAAIAAMLDKLPPRVSAATRGTAEATLATQASRLTLDELQAVLGRAEAALDPDGLEPRIEDLRAKRSLKIVHEAGGMTVITLRADPENAAPVIAAIEGIVTHQLRASRGHNEPARNDAGAVVDSVAGDDGAEGRADADTAALRGSGDAEPVFGLGTETRTLSHMRVDALVAIARHVLGCDQNRVPGSSTKVVVRMTLDQTQADATGVATIDGIEQPIDAGTARRAAAHAGIIPLVLGTKSEVLDLGRENRNFSAAQRLALGERDGGCSGCHLPPAFTEAHHLTLWSHGGRTDLDDGLLLCTGCHHRVHDEGWEIRIETPPGAPRHTGVVWFIPPPHIDPARTPRMGGRHRYDPLQWHLAA